MPAVIRSGCRAKKIKGFAPFPSFPSSSFRLLSSSSLFLSLPFASGGKWKEEEEKVKSSSTFSWRTSEQKNRFLIHFLIFWSRFFFFFLFLSF
jgi:hypothetical protein